MHSFTISGGMPAIAFHLNSARGFPDFPSFIPTDIVRFTERARAPLSLVGLSHIILLAVWQ